MNFKTTIVLIALLAVVGAVLFFTDHGSNSNTPKPDDQTDTAGRKLFDMTADKITRLVILAHDGTKTTLEHVDGKWRLASPIAARADDFKASSFVDLLTTLRSQGRPAADVSDTGLSEPRYRVDFTTDDGKTITLKIGNKTGIGDMQFAQLGDSSDINLIDSSLDKKLSTAADDLRDMTLLDVASNSIRQLRIATDDSELALAQFDGKWSILSPQALPGDVSEITSLLSTLVTSKATQFIKPGSREMSFARFDHPTMQIWLSTSAPTTRPATTQISAPTGGVTLIVGSADGVAKQNYFVKLPDGTIAKISATSLDALKKTPLDLRDRVLATIKAADVSRIALHSATFSAPTTRPATQPATAPTTQSATEPPAVITIPGRMIAQSTVTLVRRVETSAPLGPSLPTTLPASRASTASSQPTTEPTSQPATLPSADETPSTWQFSDDPKTNVDDSKVAALLSRFEPLRTSQFLAALPDAPPTKTWSADLLVLPMNGAAAGGPSGNVHIDVNEYSGGQSPVAVFNGAIFEVGREVLDGLGADFKKPLPGAPTPLVPPAHDAPPMTDMPR